MVPERRLQRRDFVENDLRTLLMQNRKKFNNLASRFPLAFMVFFRVMVSIRIGNAEFWRIVYASGANCSRNAIYRLAPGMCIETVLSFDTTQRHHWDEANRYQDNEKCNGR